jgi:GNAT superfamily N-acetyltransferase
VTDEPPLALEPLDGEHRVAAFDCGVAALNDYLTRRALSDQQAGKSRTLVAARGKRVVAFVSLAAASVEPSSATGRVAKGQGAQGVPVILIARLAVDASEQRCGLGAAMLVEALARCARAAELVGVRAILVHAKDEQARSFYMNYGFEASPTHPLHLLMLMKDVRQNLTAELGSCSEPSTKRS